MSTGGGTADAPGGTTSVEPVGGAGRSGLDAISIERLLQLAQTVEGGVNLVIGVVLFLDGLLLRQGHDNLPRLTISRLNGGASNDGNIGLLDLCNNPGAGRRRTAPKLLGLLLHAADLGVQINTTARGGGTTGTDGDGRNGRRPSLDILQLSPPILVGQPEHLHVLPEAVHGRSALGLPRLHLRHLGAGGRQLLPQGRQCRHLLRTGLVQQPEAVDVAGDLGQLGLQSLLPGVGGGDVDVPDLGLPRLEAVDLGLKRRQELRQGRQLDQLPVPLAIQQPQSLHVLIDPVDGVVRLRYIPQHLLVGRPILLHLRLEVGRPSLDGLLQRRPVLRLLHPVGVHHLPEGGILLDQSLHQRGRGFDLSHRLGVGGPHILELAESVGLQLLQKLGGGTVERFDLLRHRGLGGGQFRRHGVQTRRQGGHLARGGGNVVGQQRQLGPGGVELGPQTIEVGGGRRFDSGDPPVDLLDPSLDLLDAGSDVRHIPFDGPDGPREVLELVVHHVDLLPDGLDVGLEVR
mmetsp:Transcript_18347/g.52513  ORF Transcript_18347/g.52513 Transcript_18347/m.52513 type:complete len:516 (+) Transcript_18347:2575-4122(+)